MQLARVESRAAAARGLGAGDRDAGEGRRPPNSPKTTVRYSLVGPVAVVPLEQYLGSSSQHPCQSAVLPHLSIPGRRLNRGTERTSQVCYITGHRSIYIWLFIQGARCNQPESFRINPGTHSSKLGN